jgi:hypothetical protein
VKELQERVEDVKRNSSGDMDGVQGAGHEMDTEDVRILPLHFHVLLTPS